MISLNKELYYLNQGLKNQLMQMHKFPLTVIEAPSGFGKTTAISEHFNNEIYQSTPIHWYTSMGESLLITWQGICELLKRVDAYAAEALHNIDIQSDDAQVQLVTTLEGMTCETTTFMIIDNFQMVHSDVSRILLQSFSSRTVANFHLIILTQQLEIYEEYSFHNEIIHRIDAAYFYFDKESIARYFRLSGVRIKEADLEHIHQNAAGWAVAVHLNLINYKEKGTYVQTSGIWELIESALWHKLLPEEQDFLMSVSVLDVFTPVQAAMMIGEKSLPRGILQLLRTNTFINYLHQSGVYSIHSIMLEFLRNQFYLRFDCEVQHLVFKRAAQSCLTRLDYYHAIPLFLKIKDYEAILCLPLQDDYFKYNLERYIMEGIVQAVKKCPVEILIKYPISLITFAFQVILYGQHEVFGYLCEVIESVFDNPGDFTEKELRCLQGEMAFVQSFTVYNDIEKMVAYYLTAYELLGKPSRFSVVQGAWTFGGVSVLYMFWRKIGTLRSAMACMDANLSCYTKLTHGHGTGGASMMKAEVMLMQGNDQDAEALCHKGLYLARQKGQTSICLCAELVLARIALLRGDAEGYKKAVESMMQYLDAPSADWQVKRMVDLCKATLTVSMGETISLPEWIWKEDGQCQKMYALIQPYCHILYGKHLLLNKRYCEIYGLSSPYITMAEEMNYVLPQVFQFIYLAIAKNAQGHTEDAKKYLGRALSYALEDDVYLPFAENALAILPMLEKWDYLVPDREKLNSIIALCKRQAEGVSKVKNDLKKIKTVLTPRETEVARLVKAGNGVKAIAEMLFISDATVKTILKSVYFKLEIHSKVELIKLEL